jgi:hypothetical protein
MLIPVTEDNRRLDGVEETSAQRHDIDFRVVYVPPHFTSRITILFAWMWIFSVLLGLSTTLIPCISFLECADLVLLGRRLFVALFGAETPTLRARELSHGQFIAVDSRTRTRFVRITRIKFVDEILRIGEVAGGLPRIVGWGGSFPADFVEELAIAELNRGSLQLPIPIHHRRRLEAEDLEYDLG